MSLILSNSPPDNPSTDDIIAIIDYVCGYACKDSEPTGATADLFKDMVNAVDATDADQVTGKSMCAKMLIKTVGRRDTVSYTHLRAHETDSYLVCRLLLEKKK